MPSLAAIERISSCSQGYSWRCSITSRTVRSRNFWLHFDGRATTCILPTDRVSEKPGGGSLKTELLARLEDLNGDATRRQIHVNQATLSGLATRRQQGITRRAQKYHVYSPRTKMGPHPSGQTQRVNDSPKVGILT